MKETHYKLKHRVTALFAAAVMLCSMLPGAAFAEEPTPQPTEETAQMEQQTEPSETDNGQTDESSPDPGEDVTEATPETAEEQPAEEEISAAVVGAELYTDLPDAPIGSYIGSEGLPVATGETKIGIYEWPESQLEESDSYLTAAALDNDGLTMVAPLLDGADYAIVPIMAQVEYPADGSSTDMILPDGVTLLDYYGEPATDADALLHNSYHETSAAVMGVYVQATADFNAQLVYTGPDGSTQTKTLYVTIDREHTVASPFADAGIAAYGERPIPDVTSGKITKVAKVNGTWLIWFNGEPAYCCTPGADGQPKNCPTYTYVNTSMVGADQYVPGDHYGNQYRIWGGLTQLSLGMQELPPVALSAEAPSLLDSCRTIYTDAQMQIIENYPDSTAAKILIGSAQTLLEGTDAYASARGYYTYIYQPGRAGWQTVAVIGPEISDDEPNPKPIVQEIYANWEAPAQTASGSFDFDYGIITNKVQLKTTEKVDGATIEIEPITKSGTIDGGTWNISPADKQTVTTAGHTNDDNFQNNGGAASASWTLHYSVSKTTDSRNGRVGPYTTQGEADAAADSARDAAIAELRGEAQRMVDNAVASAKAELANVKFHYEEVGVPYGFEMYWGSNGSNQTISVPANSNNAYLMKNDEWSLQVNIKKTDSETGNQIAADAQYEIFQWDTVTGKYQPTGGYNTYSVQRQGDGTYVSGFNCIPQNAYEIMMETKQRWRKPVKDGNILAYHIIQSFSPGEATPDQVHQIGCEFAQRFLADRFECTVSTHLDRGHLHNHIVVNSVSYADGKMFRSDFNTYYKGIRETSDELCRENRLSVIETDGKGKSYDEWLSGQTGKPTIRGMVRKDVEQAIAAADSFDGFITELQNMGYTVKYGPRVEHMAVRHKDAQRNIRIDRLDPRFSETALREYYHKLHRMPTEMQQEYRQENAPAKPKWQPTELQPTVQRARYRGKLPRRYPKVSGFMACYYHYCALLRKAYHGKATKRCYFLLREDFLLFSRYQQQTKFLWENHIETMDELLAYKENAEVQIQQLARQRKVLYRQKREPERAAREEKIKSLTQQMKALRHEVYICSDIETDAADVQEKLRQAELAAQEERNEVKQDEQRRRSSRSDGAGSLTGYRSSH